MPDVTPKDFSVRELFDLTGRRALITGAAGYLGSAFARGLAQAGATVAVSDIGAQMERAEAMAAELPSPGGAKHVAVEIDQMDEESLHKGFRLAVERLGGLEVLVNNGHEPLGKDWTDATGTQFTRQLANATGYFLLARLMHTHAVERDSLASIIMIGSMYGMVASYPQAYEGIGPANPVAYQTMKAGVLQMTRHLAVYWGRDGVRVNAISPGPFPPEKAPREMIARLCEHSPMNRMGRPHELVGALVFLASDASSYVTGQNVVVDGGWTAW